MMGHQMRWTWTNREIKRLIQKGALGKIYSAKVGWLRRKGIPGWGSWFTRMAESGGGPLIDIGVHMLDLSIYLMGDPKPISVYGSTYAEFGPKKQGLGTWGTPNWKGFYDVEDLATALIKMDDGSTLSLDVSWAAHTDKSNDIFLKIFGTEGGLVVYNNNEATLCGEKFERPCNIELVPPENTEDARMALSQHFVDCIRENKTPIADALSGVVNSAIIDAIYQSAQTGKSIELNWDKIGENT
jgi:predicted dehydrogenase